MGASATKMMQKVYWPDDNAHCSQTDCRLASRCVRQIAYRQKMEQSNRVAQIVVFQPDDPENCDYFVGVIPN